MIDDSAQVTGSKRLCVQAVFWNSIVPGSMATALVELLENMAMNDVEPHLWCLWQDGSRQRTYTHPVIPDLFFRVLAKARVPAEVQGRMGRHCAIRAIKAGDIVYMWPPFDLSFVERARERGAIIIAERTNCMAALARERVASAYARRSVPMPAGWFKTHDMAEERDRMLRCDFVTANNALVKQSLLEAGVAEEHILDTSYGFSPQRLASAMTVERPERPPVFAFVGSGSISKGLDVLLEAWERANVNGKLLIAGEIDPEIRATYKHVLARHDVDALGWVHDVEKVYAAADIFVFPTHTEGGPLVVYEAAACGLPSIISPMGCGRLVRDGEEGLVVDPLKVDEVAVAITTLAEELSLRQTLARNARERAQKFTWQKVGTRLYGLLRDITENPSCRPRPWDESTL